MKLFEYTHWSIDSAGVCQPLAAAPAGNQARNGVPATALGLAFGAFLPTAQPCLVASPCNSGGTQMVHASNVGPGPIRNSSARKRKVKLSASYWREVAESGWFKRAHDNKSIGAELVIA